jgi:hypothetical protein
MSASLDVTAGFLGERKDASMDASMDASALNQTTTGEKLLIACWCEAIHILVRGYLGIAQDHLIIIAAVL